MVGHKGHVSPFKEIVGPDGVKSPSSELQGCKLPFHWRNVWEPHGSNVIVVVLSGRKVMG